MRASTPVAHAASLIATESSATGVSRWIARLVALAALVGMLLFPSALLAQATGITKLTGSFGTGAQPAGRYYLTATFNCDYASGTSGPCTGTVAFTERDETCSNSYSNSGTMSLSGFDPSRTGPYQAQFAVTLNSYDFSNRPDGTCAYEVGPVFTGTVPVSGTWNGATGTIALPPSVDSRGNPIVTTGSFTSFGNAPPPVFPMSVTSSITATSAQATAAIQFRPQDVGTSASI